ncbi:hypothetical protein R6Q59_006075 [Mikania micrantha]
MSIFARKLVLCFISFCSIYLIHTTTLAQPPHFLSYSCSDSNYTANSSYQRNLNTALSSLLTTNRGLGFYRLAIGEGNDTVNLVALCRGDVNPDVCDNCLNNSIVRLRQICPTQKGARGYYDYCLLRYSNQKVVGNIGGGLEGPGGAPASPVFSLRSVDIIVFRPKILRSPPFSS